MRKKMVVLAFLVAALLPTIGGSPAALKDVNASRSGHCPKGSHLISCPNGSFCCPDGALCVCGPS